MYNKRIINNKYVILESPININNDIKKQIEFDNSKDIVDDDKNLKEANKIISNAEKKASEIIKKAEKDSRNIILEAEKEAKNIYDKKKKSIEVEYKNELKKILTSLSKSVDNNINDLKNTISDYSSYSNIFLNEVIKSVIKKYLKEEIFNKPMWINEVIEILRKKLTSFKKVLIRMNSDMTNNYSEMFKSNISENFIIKEDNTLLDNEINIETELGVYDISPDMFVHEIMENLEESFDENSSS